MNSLMQDLRFAARQLRKSPGFAVTAILTLALGIGVNIAVFALVDGILLRPIPYADSRRVEIISASQKDGAYELLNYADIDQLSKAIGPSVKFAEQLNSTRASVVGPGGRYQITASSVTPNMIDLLGVPAMLGSASVRREQDAAGEQAVVLGEDVWRKVFDSDPQVVGKTLIIRGVAYTILGVMPKTFSFPYGESMQVWMPTVPGVEARTAMTGADQLWANLIFARVPEGMTAAQLNARLNSAQAEIVRELPNAGLPTAVTVKSYQEWLNQDGRKPLELMSLVVLALWALACMNVTSMMLARAVARGRELAVRSALGASWIRLLQQSIVESMLLCGLGGMAGLLAGEVALKLLWQGIEQNLPMTSGVHVEWRVIVALIALTFLTALIVGAFPVVRATRQNLQGRLHGVNSTASTGQTRTREALVVAQMTLTVLFLVGAGMLLRTIHAMEGVPLGFREQNVLTGGISLHYVDANHVMGGSSDPAKQTNVVQTIYQPLLQKLRAIPGVSNVALSTVLPMRPSFAVFMTVPLDHADAPASQQAHAYGNISSYGMMDTLGASVKRGRFFTQADTTASPLVVVVNQAFADQYLPGRDAIGHTISLGKKGPFAEARIVGVIGNMKQGDVTVKTRPEIYFCLEQMAPGRPLYGITTMFMEVAIRGAVPAENLRAEFEKVLHEIAPDATTIDVETIHEAVENSFSGETLTSYLLACFAALAMLIASVGLHGLLSFVVAQRTREFGLRIALGAEPEAIFRLVLRRAVVLLSSGLLCGIVASWFAVSLVRSYLFGVPLHDGFSLVGAALVLAAASFLAAWIPARRAAAVEPMQALRNE